MEHYHLENLAKGLYGLLQRKMSKFLVSMKRCTVFLVTKEIHIKSLSNSTIY